MREYKLILLNTKGTLMKSSLLLILMSALLFVSCKSDEQLKKDIMKIMAENPQILTEAIEKNPAEFMTAIQKAAKNAQSAMAKKREDDEKKKFEQAMDKPLQPVIRSDEAIRGTRGGPIVLVEYSDFQCPYCTKGFKTALDIMDKYKGKVQFIFKHLPLSFHPQAMIASQYYEAIRLQSEKKAFAFHDEVFKNQGKLRIGESFLKKLAKKVGANMKKLAKDYNSDAVIARIEEDKKEAAKFGMQGTPGFLLNGVPVRGAYPLDYFVGIVEKLKAKGKLKL